MANQRQDNRRDQLTDSELEIVKMYGDTFKHIMTFSSGALLLTASVVAALFPGPMWVGMIAGAIGLFVVGLGGAVWGLLKAHETAQQSPRVYFR